MSEWKESRIDELTSCIIDCVNKTAPSVNYVTPYKMIRTTNVKEGRLNLSEVKYVEEDVFIKWTRRGILQKNDILLTREAPLGEIARITNETNYFLGQRLVMYRPDITNVDPDFLFYAMLGREVKYQIKALGMGSTVEHMRVPDCSDLVINHPKDIEEQAQLGKTLSNLDKKITLLRQQNQDLEELAQTIFKRWFVEFEFPNENGEPYKSSGGNMVASELGEIPEGWQLGTLSDIADLTIGRTPPRKESHWFSTDKNDVKWISIKDMGNSGVFIKKTSEYLTKEAVEKFRVPVIPKNTTILSFKLTVGRVAITTENMLSNEAIAHIRLKEDFDCFQFSYLLLKSYNYDRLGSTSSIATAVNSNSIKNMEVLIPTSNIIKSFDTYTIGIFNKLRNNTEEIQTLTQLRDTLLPKLMSGELRVKM